MSIKVQGGVQTLYNTYAASDVFAGLKTQDRCPPEVLRKDAVALSKEGRTFGEILNRLIVDNSKVRKDKVDFYMQQIEEGSYHVAARDIAAKMIDQRV